MKKEEFLEDIFAIIMNLGVIVLFFKGILYEWLPTYYIINFVIFYFLKKSLKDKEFCINFNPITEKIYKVFYYILFTISLMMILYTSYIKFILKK